jgi:hypothetical protein
VPASAAEARLPAGAPSVPGAPGEVSSLASAPNGTPIPIERIGEAGYTRTQAEALREVAEREGVVIGSRTTNPDSAAWIDRGAALPKPMEVKAKTTTELDTLLGASPDNRGLVTLFEPKPPPFDISRPDVAADPRAVAAWDRYASRMSDYQKLAPEVRANPNLRWDEATGVIYDRATGKPFAGDIDLVYVRDAKTGELIGGDRYRRIAEQLGDSGARTQHGAEVNAPADITAMKGPGATDDALKLHTSLSRGHETGAETVIETSASGWQKGPSPRGMYDSHSPGGDRAGLRRGIGMELPE